jgi:hypothetical protein
VVPIANNIIDNGAQIELGAKSVKHHATVDDRCGESGFVCLKRVSAFRRLHAQIDDWVELDGHLVNLNWLKRLVYKHIVCLWCNRALVRHDGTVTTA